MPRRKSQHQSYPLLNQTQITSNKKVCPRNVLGSHRTDKVDQIQSSQLKNLDQSSSKVTKFLTKEDLKPNEVEQPVKI